MSGMRVVMAPDSFKGSITAAEAAEALTAGWREARPGDVVVQAPMADGGEGVLDAFERAVPGAIRVPVIVTAPDDRVVESSWLRLPDGTGVVEMASTSGITMIDRLRPLEAHSIGFGQAVRAALDGGVERLMLAIGGSASTDGGAGMLTELGARLMDGSGLPVVAGNVGLADVVTIDFAAMVPLPPSGAVVLGDVTNPLLGRSGAVAVFGPQKGIATSMAVPAEERLAAFARVVQDARGTDPETAGAGAAGGVGFALAAWGAELRGGAAAVAEAIHLRDALHGADVVVTGEGRFDSQSEQGKVPGHVRDEATVAGARTLLVAGVIADSPRGFADAVSLTELARAAGATSQAGAPPGDADSAAAEAAMADPRRWLQAAAAALAARLPG